MKSWCLFLIVFGGILSFTKAEEDIVFDHFLRNDGLSNNSVRQIYQDKSGFLWFGTLNGLNKYDGVRVTVYQNQKGVEGTISGNRISRFFEDGQGSFWVSTKNGKAFRYNELKDNFESLNEYLPAHYRENVAVKDFIAFLPNEFFCMTRNSGFIHVKLKEDKSILSVNLHTVNEGLSDNHVNFIYQDSSGMAWIGTNSGLDYLQNDQLKRVKTNDQQAIFKQNVIYFRYCDLGNTILLGTRTNGVLTLDKNTQTVSVSDQYKETQNTQINHVMLMCDNQLLIATNEKGFFIHDLTNDQFRQFNKGYQQLDHSSIYDPIIDHLGMVWFETLNRGIYQFNPTTESITYFSLNAENRISIGDDEKLSVFEDSNNDLWIGVYGGGICKFDRTENRFSQYTYDPQNAYGITSDYVLSLFEDNSNNLWIGTLKGGLNKINLNAKNFKVTSPEPDSKLKIENEVRSVITDSKGHLWIGTQRGKVYCYDADYNKIAIIPDQLSQSRKIAKAGVYSLMEDHKGNIWVGTKGEGIYVIKDLVNTVGTQRRLNNEVLHFNYEEGQSTGISNNDIYDLLEVSKNEVWVATYGGGLNIIESPFDKPSYFNYTATNSDKNSLSNNWVRCLMKDKYNNIWIGTEDGLNLVDEMFTHSRQKSFKVYKSEDTDKNSLSNNDILCITQTSKGDLWCGTFGGGVNRFKNYKGTGDIVHWDHYSTEKGLSSNMVFKLLEDRSGDLWIGTDYGLSRFEYETETFKNFHIHQKEEENAYSENAGVKMDDGSLVFGHLNGFTSFLPDSIGSNKKHYPIRLTDLYVFNEKVQPGNKSILSQSINHTTDISLKYNQNFITIDYAMLDFENPGEIEYAYILEGFEKSWNYVGNISRANYKGLPPGKYVFKVSATNNQEPLGDNVAQLNIDVQNPWWSTVYAIIGYVLLLTGIVLGVGAVILKQLKLQNMVQLEKENTDNKLRFYTNISHELKTPLSLILGPAEDLMGLRNLPSQAQFKAHEIVRNAKRMLELIDQLLDFRKIQKGHIPLHVSEQNITEFFREIYFSFLPLAEKQKIHFIYDPEVQIIGYIDVDKIEKIVFNLISNSFKHTPAGKTIKIELENKGEFSFSIVDQGKGIHPEDLPYIFDRFRLFAKSEHVTQRSSGIGLSLTQELVKVHKGAIDVQSKVGEGTTFKVLLPIQKSAYTADEIVEGSNTSVHFLNHVNEYIENEQDEGKLDAEMVKRNAGADASKVLIIEDNEDLRKYLFLNLKPYYNVILAEHGKEGVEKAREEFPDLIISDVMMPEMDGIEVTKQLKTEFNTSHIPIILLTAKSTEEQKLEGMETGADAYVTKPFSLQLLKAQMRNLIDQRKKLIQKFGNKAEVTPVDLGGTNTDQAFLTKVISIIENHMSDPGFNVNSIVQEFGYGRTVFYKKLKAIAGYAPNDFVRIIRMKKAASALKNTEMTIAEISFMTGFNDSNYFSRTFKKHFGVTPTEYRKGEH